WLATEHQRQQQQPCRQQLRQPWWWQKQSRTSSFGLGLSRCRLLGRSSTGGELRGRWRSKLPRRQRGLVRERRQDPRR
ncbi:hypothetical protein PIB30_083621, partial [Stylosanthes scabra]|nr:hypothetical protein [Stylosanthes scabra]